MNEHDRTQFREWNNILEVAQMSFTPIIQT